VKSQPWIRIAAAFPSARDRNLDAPLSYGLDGKSRPADSDLRARVQKLGLPPGSVMAPTAPRMAYLTLRGVSVARALGFLGSPHDLSIVEVHPGAALALGGAPVESIRTFREDLAARDDLLRWLAAQGLEGIGWEVVTTDHSVAACAAAWAAWLWRRGESNWIVPADPPHHPFDFAC